MAEVKCVLFCYTVEQAVEVGEEVYDGGRSLGWPERGLGGLHVVSLCVYSVDSCHCYGAERLKDDKYRNLQREEVV